MTDTSKTNRSGLRIQRYLLTGILTLFPLWLTYTIFEWVLKKLSDLSAPWLDALLRRIGDTAPAFVSIVEGTAVLRFMLALLMTLVVLYVVGWLANLVIGKKLLSLFDGLINRIPLVQTIYGGSKKLLTALQTRPEGAERVVLIDFPSPEMKTVGLVTRVIREEGTGRELAAVYVPTTPNPTSGYLEIVPLDKLTPTNWTVDQAMTFIISGGAVSPDAVPYDRPEARDNKA